MRIKHLIELYRKSLIFNFLVDILFCMMIINFIFLPCFNHIMGLEYPLRSVVSGSMSHQDDYYLLTNITDFKKGINTGDGLIFRKILIDNYEIGDVVLFDGGRKYQIFHRIVNIKQINNQTFFTTKGDANQEMGAFEIFIPQEKIEGKAVLRIPYIGLLKYHLTKNR